MIARPHEHASRQDLLGDILTAAGVSSGLDRVLDPTARLQGEDLAKAIEMMIEDDPVPPLRYRLAKLRRRASHRCAAAAACASDGASSNMTCPTGWGADFRGSR